MTSNSNGKDGDFRLWVSSPLGQNDKHEEEAD